MGTLGHSAIMAQQTSAASQRHGGEIWLGRIMKVRRPMKPIAVNSLFRPKNSVFAGQSFPVPIGQGIRRNPPELRHEPTSGRAEMAGNLQIPCYFPCSQGI
jgi:hypothetical protein